MPVAVDRTLDMGASSDIGNAGDPILRDPATAERTKKARLYRVPKKLREVVLEQPVAGSSTEPTREDGSTWAWRSLTESSASKVKPVFTKDGSYFMTAAGANVKIYSVASGQVVSTLTVANTSSRPAAKTGYGEAITSMILSPHNPFQLFTAAMDGCVRIWDFVDAVLLQTIDLGLPVLQLAAHEKFKNEVYVALSKKTKKLNAHKNPTKEDNAVVMRISLTPTNATARLPVQQSAETRHIGKARAPVGLAFSPSGSWLVAIGAHKAYVARTTDLQSGFTKLVSPDKLTCLAFHPTEEYFATGDTRGLVRLWYCLNDSIPSGVSGVEKKAPTTTLHWHAHPVASIAFTANGAYLLSGGEEAVLVIWQLHTGKKEFVPRVGAPISTVTLSTSTSNEEEYLLGLSDASFVFVRSGTLRLGKTIARVKLDPAISHERPSSSTRVPLAAHAISSTLILPSSHPSTLQLYAPTTSKLLSELEVSPSNRISRRDEKALEPCRVEVAAVTDSGEWMATLDTREGDESFRGEVYLKLWAWDRKAAQWVLNTRIDRPHGLSKVNTISFRPRSRDDASLLLATTGEDGLIKMWGIRSSTTKTGQSESYWVARSTVQYRSETPTHASWSQDGSLLAVSLGPYVVLYDPTTMVVVRTLNCPECSVISSAHFIGRSGRYIALRSPRDLVVWDLVLDSVNWHYRSYSYLTHIYPHPREDTFLAFETDPKSSRPKTHILKFTPTSSVPTPTSTYTLPFRLQSVSPCPARWLASSDSSVVSVSSYAFVGVTHDWQAVVFGDQVRLGEADASEGKGLVGSIPVTKHTLFQDIFGKSAFADLSNRAAQVSVGGSGGIGIGGKGWKGKQVEEVFKTPAYLMPPLGTLFDPLMDEFLKPRVASAQNGGDAQEEEQEEDGDGDVAMEVEGEGEGAEAPIVVGNRLERIVDDAEMVTMIEVFKSHCLQPVSAQPAQTSTSSTPKINGYHKYTPSSKPSGVAVNGVPSHTQGTPVPPVTTAKVNGVVHTPGPSDAESVERTSSSSLPVKAGQKRKKSLG